MPELLNFSIMLVVALFHFYWVLGGKFGSEAVIPHFKGKPKTMPPVIATLFVAFVFFGFGLVYLNKFYDLISFPNDISILILGIIFIIRAIGEFNYIGFSKRIYNSKFATYDTKFFSPLCLLLSLNSFYIYYYH